jgi:hypothetical protein
VLVGRGVKVADGSGVRVKVADGSGVRVKVADGSGVRVNDDVGKGVDTCTFSLAQALKINRNIMPMNLKNFIYYLLKRLTGWRFPLAGGRGLGLGARFFLGEEDA